MSYADELRDLDRSQLLHADIRESVSGFLVTFALYRQPDGSAKLHITDPCEDGGGFVDVLDRDDEAAFWFAELDAWEPTGRAC